MIRIRRMGLLGLGLLVLSSCRMQAIDVPMAQSAGELLSLSPAWSAEDPPARAGFAASGDTLWILLQSESPMLARGLRRGEITFWMDVEGGKRKTLGLQFRGPLREPRGREGGGLTGDRQGEADRPRRGRFFNDRLGVSEQVHILRDEEESTSLLPADSPLEDCSRFVSGPQGWDLWLALPLGVSLDDRQDAVIQPGSGIGFGLVETREPSSFRSRPGRDMRQGGGPPGGGKARGGGGRGGMGRAPGGGPGGERGGGPPQGSPGGMADADPLKIWFRLQLP